MSVFPVPTPDFERYEAHGLTDLFWSFVMISGASVIIYSLYKALLDGFFGPGDFALLLFEVSLFTFYLADIASKERYFRQDRLALQTENLNEPIWIQSVETLKRTGFVDLGITAGFTLLSRDIGTSTEEFDGAEVVVKKLGITVAVANVLRIHDRACWKFESSDLLEENGRTISLSSMFSARDINERIVSAQRGKSDFVSLGLVSHCGDDSSSDEAEALSDQRAHSLGLGLLKYTSVNTECSDFHAIGLGKARIPSQPNSSECKQQRAAIILAISRRATFEEFAFLEDISSALVQSVQAGGVRLSEYSRSHKIADLLRVSSVDFAGYVPVRS